MAVTKTTNYSLLMPDKDEFIKPDEFNDNFYQLDEIVASKQDKPSIVADTLYVSSWSNNQYSFESKYPSATYNVEVGINGDSATDDQYKAWTAAKAMNSMSNVLKIKGKTPTVDIPIILKVVNK